MTEVIDSVGGHRSMAIEIIEKTVTIKVNCIDAYEATILHDDLVSRLKEGQTIEISFTPQNKGRP